MVLQGTRDGRSNGESGAEIVKPPLVSLVVINWNYASYVGAAIDSIRSQDYPSIEAIVVDNGSTDASREVIAKHVGDDERFRVVHLKENLGQLGAYFDVFKLIRGEFVTIVDADDVLFPNFISSHVQVHLALPASVALTSSNVVEMTAEGRALTSGYAAFGHRAKPASRGLRPLHSALTLPTVSASDYLQLARSTSTSISGGTAWIWGPGTANMYRRSVLALVQQEPKNRAYFRAADNYLNRFCHVLGGSGLIDMRLSAYRVHDANYFTLRETVGNLRAGRIEFSLREHQERRDSIEFLLQRAAFFEPLLRSRFWLVLQHLFEHVSDRWQFFSDPDTRKLFVDNYASLARVFGERNVLAGLRRTLTLKQCRAVIREAHGGRIPPRLRLALMLERGKSARAAARKAVRKVSKIVARRVPWAKSVARKMPLALARKKPLPRPEDNAVEFGPVAALCFDPPIFMTGMAFQEMIGIAPAFGRTYGSRPAAFLVYPCWTIEDRHRSRQVIEAARAHREEYPEHELVFLCNTAAERELLAASGLNAYLLNKNFMVSDTVFRPLADAQIEFDAVYNARFDPRKRHELAGAVPRVAYLSYPCASAGPYEEQRDSAARILARHPGHAVLNPVENGLPVRLPPRGVNAALNRAAVGLCLSNVEGSNYASMEYMLAGLPVVSTPSTGGREIYFDHEYCTICEPNPNAVRDAVAALKARNIPRDYIRARTLAKIEPERRRFLSLIDDLSERLGGKRRYDDGTWPFGATGQLVTWKNYRDHLLDFGRGRGVQSPDQDSGPDAGIETPPAEAEGIQMQPPELETIVQAIRSRPGCSLLVFGCGNDSVFWEGVNRDGTTAFLEDDPAWAEKVRPRLKTGKVYLVKYGTKLSEWVSLLHASDRLELDLPELVSSKRWDVIVIDGPAGYDNHEHYFGREAPGRMKSIYMASKLVAPGGCVFVHDCERLVEQNYAAQYLGTSRLFVTVRGHAVLQGYAF